MRIYCVKYPTGYDYDEIMGYFLNEKDAETYCKKVNKDNPGLDAHVDEVDVN